MPPPIHMDVDSVRMVVDQLVRKEARLKDMIKDLTRAVVVLEEGDWVGNSPNQFFGEYNEFASELLKQVEQMETLAGRLRQAVRDYKSAAAKLS